jgi:cell division protein FtsZ
MTINLKAPELRELKPRIMVCGVGGAGGNAVNNMIVSGLSGVDFIVANTDAQALASSRAERIIQIGLQATEGLGAGSKPEVGRVAAEEAIEEIRDHLSGAHMVFITAGMGGGTGTGAAPIIAQSAREMGILTVGVVTKPFHFEGGRRMRVAEAGITELQKSVDTLIVIPNQNLFRVANEKTTFADAFSMADQVLYSGVACITDLMVKEGLINLDFADVRAIMAAMGKAMMGTGEASGDRRAVLAAEAAIANPLLDETSMRGARGLLISITGGSDLTLYEVDEAASRIRQEIDEDANIILGATFDSALDGVVRVSVVATGIDQEAMEAAAPPAKVEAPAKRTPAVARALTTPITESPAISAPAAVTPAPIAPRIVPANEPIQVETIAAAAVETAAPAREELDFAPDEAADDFVEEDTRPFRGPRIPQAEDFPPIAQEQIRHAARGETPPEPKSRSLLDRLRDFGITRSSDRPAATAEPERPAPAPAPAPRAASMRAPSANEFGRPQVRAVSPRPAQGQLDAHGRSRPAQVEEDHLEIPAFLRRQAR